MTGFHLDPLTRWGHDYALDGSKLTSFIRNLRTEIEPDTDNQQYIITVLGVVISSVMKDMIKRETQNFYLKKDWTSLCLENISSYQGSFSCGKFVAKQVSFSC